MIYISPATTAQTTIFSILGIIAYGLYFQENFTITIIAILESSMLLFILFKIIHG
jgi:hypothetical protein